MQTAFVPLEHTSPATRDLFSVPRSFDHLSSTCRQLFCVRTAVRCERLHEDLPEKHCGFLGLQKCPGVQNHEAFDHLHRREQDAEAFYKKMRSQNACFMNNEAAFTAPPAATEEPCRPPNHATHSEGGRAPALPATALSAQVCHFLQKVYTGRRRFGPQHFLCGFLSSSADM